MRLQVLAPIFHPVQGVSLFAPPVRPAELLLVLTLNANHAIIT